MPPQRGRKDSESKITAVVLVRMSGECKMLITLTGAIGMRKLQPSLHLKMFQRRSQNKIICLWFFSAQQLIMKGQELT